MKASIVLPLVIAGFIVLTPVALAQKAPESGYIFPVGGKAGTTVEVRLGGYDWTPDMEFFSLDKRVQLIPAGPLGAAIVSPPPYWFGAKGRLVSHPIPREVTAKLVIPADLPPGAILWQAANANGSTSPRMFIVGTGPEVVEDEARKVPQLLASLPMTVSGRLLKNEEVDRYRFIAAKDGPITCDLMARRLGTKFNGILEVRDSNGRLVADALGTSAADPCLTFAAKAKAEYVVSVNDIDFGGDRAYVYRLTVAPGPRIVGALPAAGKRGETRDVEFVGIGVETGAVKLESVKRRVAFPAQGNAFDYRLETPWGVSLPFPLLLSDLPEIVGASGAAKQIGPTGITGVLGVAETVDRYLFDWKKGDAWSLAVQAHRIGSPLDVVLAVIGPDGKELARNDDLPGTTDAGLEFTVPVDGTYQLLVSDMSGKSGARSAIYRLVVRQPVIDFTLQLASPRVNVPLDGKDGKLDLAVTAVRKGGFKGPIALTVQGLPAGISVPASLVIPADKAALSIPLQWAKDTATAAGVVTVTGTAMVGAANVTRMATAPAVLNLAPKSPDENQVAAIVVAGTLKPRFKGRPVDQDTGRKVYRGSTHPAEVLVERLEGFTGEIVLQMAATQSYQMQGITGGDVIVPPGVAKTIYPVFMPEWLETTRTSRMGMIAVAKVPDPKGKIRYLVNNMEGFITMTLEGALLKVSADDQELAIPAGQPFDVPLKVLRLTKLAQPVKLELRLEEELVGQLKADPVVVPVGKEKAVLRITPVAGLRGMHTITIRATALHEGKYLVVSETHLPVEFRAAAQASR